MQFFTKDLKPITEVKYLNAEKVNRYRAIIKIFYEKYKHYIYFLYKEDIVDEMRKSDTFGDYNYDMCEQDVNQLMEWGNIVGIQDTAKAQTLDEFRNKKYIYQITEKAILIEKLVSEDLEKAATKEAELDPSIMERLMQSLEEIAKKDMDEIGDLNSFWNNLIADFERLNDNYKNYIMKLNSFKVEELMNTTQFILYKDSLIDYLRNFIKGLQKYGMLIVGIINGISESKIDEILEIISKEKKRIMVLNMEATEKSIYKDIKSQWESIVLWFMGSNTRKSEMEMLYDRTNETIRKIVRIALQISQSSRQISSRKEEFLKIAQLFSKCSNIDEAHKLSAMTFGISNTKHFKGEIKGEVEDKNARAFEKEPIEIEIKPRTRKYKEKRHAIAIIDKSHKKEEIIRQKQLQLKKEREAISEIVKKGMIEISKLETISINVRKTLLRWIVRGIETPGDRSNQNIDGVVYRIFPTSKNEDGTTYRVLMNSDTQIKLNCEDGEFYMPDIIIKIEGVA